MTQMSQANRSQANSESIKGVILIVDDTPSNAYVMDMFLTSQGYIVTQAHDGVTALDLVQQTLPDLIMLDINMPDLSGYEVCQYLKSDTRTAGIPVIFVSALGETLDKVKAFSVGGSDYITKPFEFGEILARINNQLSIRRMQKQLQQLNSELEERVHHRTAELEAANDALRGEISKREQAQQQLLHMVMHDSLTGLPNRVSVLEHLGKNINRASQDSNYGFGILFIDCDHFKVINDSLGHLVGDQLLIAIARRLEVCLDRSEILCRLGGDEFLVLLEDIDDIQQAADCAEKIQQALRVSFQIQHYEVFINASMGIVFGSDYSQPDELLRDADTAMYQAKVRGKGCYQLFESSMHAKMMSRLKLETDLRRTVEKGEFELYYQPIIRLQDCSIVGFEALLRWRHPELGWISPATFIPVAEEIGLIVAIGDWVLLNACRQVQVWNSQYGLAGTDGLTISVNISMKQFRQSHLIESIEQALMRSGLDSRYLKLEITESTVMDNPELVEDIIRQLRSRHIQLSIDDFGTGYSSLSHLHRLSVSTLKIDRSFIDKVDVTTENVAIVKAILALAENLGMEVVAEGIETEAQLNQLNHLNCLYGQGYYFARPLPQESAETYILAHLPSHALVIDIT